MHSAPDKVVFGQPPAVGGNHASSWLSACRWYRVYSWENQQQQSDSCLGTADGHHCSERHGLDHFTWFNRSSCWLGVPPALAAISCRQRSVLGRLRVGKYANCRGWHLGRLTKHNMGTPGKLGHHCTQPQNRPLSQDQADLLAAGPDDPPETTACSTWGLCQAA